MAQFDKDLSKHLKELQKEVVAILKKLRKPGLDYNIQFALDSMRPNMIEYTVWIQPPADPTDDIDVEIAYHGAQIESCEETIAHHKGEIEKLNKEREERAKENE